MPQTAFPRVRSRTYLTDAPHTASVIVGVLAALSLLSSLSPRIRHLIHGPRTFIDDYVITMPDTSFAWAFVLTLVAIALGHRKRVAWWISVIYLLIYAASNIAVLAEAEPPWLDGHGPGNRVHAGIGLAIDIAALAFLVATRKQFYTRVRRGAAFTALATLVAGLAVGTLLGWGLVELFPGTLERGERLAYAVNRVVAFAAVDQQSFAGHQSIGPVNGLLGLFGALALLAATLVLFRSQRLSGLITPPDEELIRALITTFNADDSLAYFSTRRDKAAVFAPDGRAAVTFRVEVSVGMAGGDPIGDPASWPAAIEVFLAECERYGWHPAAIGVSERGAAAYEQAGLSLLGIGDEAILHPRGFTLGGHEMRNVRHAVGRARRVGLSVRIRRHRDIPDAEMVDVVALADAWRDTEEERGFAMALGRLGDAQDGDCLLVEAISGAGTDDERCVGMLSFVPWGRTGASLDVMRRDRSSVNGIVELMVAELMAQADEFGITEVSLNFAAFREFFEQGERLGVGPVVRAMHGVLTFASRFVQMESLYRSNAKYRPQWVPRYLAFEDARVIPRVGTAAIVTEGFVSLPKFSRRPKAHRGPSAIPAGVDLPALLAELDEEARAGAPAIRRPEQVRVRMGKLDALAAAGVAAYPAAGPDERPTHTVAETAAAPAGTAVAVAGRVTALRDFGGVVFAELHDWSGQTQLVVERDALDEGTPEFARLVDLGDLVLVRGITGTSRSGQRSVLASTWRMLGKCLHPLPDKWAGLADPEAKVRQRYLDLAIDPQARELLAARSTIIATLRGFLAERGFLEVDTPILQQVHGGANATPFATHINAYDLDLYLRIAPELYLKRLCVGGVDKVFEIGRNFRNEGVDYSHNPEFTSLEAYAAHRDYLDMAVLAREMIQAAATAVHGAPVVLRPDGDGGYDRVDIGGDWPRYSVYETVSQVAGVPITPQTGVDELRELARAHGVALRPMWDAGQIVAELYEHFGEARTTAPTFYLDFPASTSPLTRPHREADGVAERWDLVAWGVELGTAYTELTDPVQQRRRLTEQSVLAAGGDPEAMELDEDFLQALEYAMPPTGGLGLGVDRIVMLITGRSIRESLPFPLTKPHQS
ncbi:bifunctional lysylphosphatidylglycerol synthetase/lysine--tRNA ligase LysX [Gordonia crocea]|uniref:Lysine--tRNA ligase n=1 Tax=Gordonia crocea TaxID=589162 RepID=A0A7M3SUD2_9ACTN|nr:bifunctional lysylphosphatidylglycerol synthetase/lysine--tRNA ligase LysX [Gordonia crocea]GED96256.1 lysylphosphatidylglycerol biosynthesis bifunctional protein LysX [Gordonia crocea]